MRQRRSCDRWLTVCSLFWLGLVTKELPEEVAHDYVCVLCKLVWLHAEF